MCQEFPTKRILFSLVSLSLSVPFFSSGSGPLLSPLPPPPTRRKFQLLLIRQSPLPRIKLGLGERRVVKSPYIREEGGHSPLISRLAADFSKKAS